MKQLSKVALDIQPSATLRVDALFKQMRQNGLDVVSFGTGEPDFDTPENIKQAAIKAIVEGKTKYTQASGMPELRKAAADRLRADCNIEYTPEQIVVASGAKHSIFAALCCVLNQGDEVILPAPYWVTYAESIRMAGGVAKIVHASEESDFKITKEQLESAVSEKTKMLILNNPSNPTGMVYSEIELEELCDVCVKHDLYILSDEIYYRFVYDGREFISVAALGDDVKERTILVNGVSKTYAMTGWRIGYTACNLNLANVMGNFLSHSTSAPSTISQIAAVQALCDTQDSVDEMCRIFKERRDYIVGRIASTPGVSCRTPQGAFYIMLNIEQLIGTSLDGRTIESSDDFALLFLEKGLVATVSCSAFGCENFVRLTYAASMETIKTGMDRLEEFVCKISRK
ncbi:MAG: pyridoxal phosphate-dependent aminotransferase [Oscillospiraceae bacterium]|nr:pyridoxal phosphate-dependent aminotransferase [Oscillospiraceae bacterium]MCL2278926.1 pyridoxal phosphate-dependent aminotransferase [Oscillospiraceae bacterium]